MDPTATARIDQHGDPLAFKTRQGLTFSETDGAITIEARQMAGHQKEAVASEGRGGTAWRLTSDEGGHLKGTDLAPFPLGFFNAGLQSDLYGRMRALAPSLGVTIDDLGIRLVNHYWLTGSFVQGTGEGHAELPDIDIDIRTSASRGSVERLVAAALDASPGIALLRTALTGNTFALYVNGRRHDVPGVENSESPNAPDPYRSYAQAPRPLTDTDKTLRLIEKTGVSESGAAELASASPTGKVIRNIYGDGKPSSVDGLFEVDTWLGLPGASHFRFVSDESGEGRAPSGLSLLCAGISFCYMTQLSRYIESMKMAIQGVRLVQRNPFVHGAKAIAGPIDTHLFLNGEAPPETHMKLLTVAARTCYLHAAAKTPLDPIVRISVNGDGAQQAA